MKQEPVSLQRSEKANESIPPDRFTAGGTRVCRVYYESRNFQDVLQLLEAEQKVARGYAEINEANA